MPIVVLILITSYLIAGITGLAVASVLLYLEANFF